jgi:hypothetical protein
MGRLQLHMEGQPQLARKGLEGRQRAAGEHDAPGLRWGAGAHVADGRRGLVLPQRGGVWRRNLTLLCWRGRALYFERGLPPQQPARCRTLLLSWLNTTAGLSSHRQNIMPQLSSLPAASAASASAALGA